MKVQINHLCFLTPDAVLADFYYGLEKDTYFLSKHFLDIS